MSETNVCNKCGKLFDMWDEAEGIKLSRCMGYGTKYDGDRLRLNLCCKCFETLISECLISPIEINT